MKKLIILAAFIVTVGCQAQVKKDTTISIKLTSSQAKYLEEIEKQNATLMAEYYKAMRFIIETKDSTALQNLVADPKRVGNYLIIKRK